MVYKFHPFTKFTKNYVIQSALEEKARLLKEAEAQLTKKVNETLPFLNMKKMLKKKNDQIKELRTKLATYEPQNEEDGVEDEWLLTSC